MVSAYFLAVAKVEKSFTGDAAFALGAAGKMMYAADGKHLRSVLGGGDMADRFALRANEITFGAEMAVGIDFQFYATITENAFGDDGDHVYAIDFGGNNERSGFVIGVSCAGADGGEERVFGLRELAVPFAFAFEERHEWRTLRFRAIEEDVRIDPDKLTVEIAVTIAGAGLPEFDVTQDGAGVAANCIFGQDFSHADFPAASCFWQ